MVFLEERVELTGIRGETIPEEEIVSRDTPQQEDRFGAPRPPQGVWVLSFQQQENFEGIFVRECLDLIDISSYPRSLHATFCTPYTWMQRDVGPMVSCLSLLITSARVSPWDRSHKTALLPSLLG